MDILIYISVIIGIIVRLVLMRGSFVLPTIYRRGNEMSFNLGSISTIIIGVIATMGLMYSNPELFVSPVVAFLTAYTAPQIVDGVVTSVVRNTVEVEHREGA